MNKKYLIFLFISIFCGISTHIFYQKYGLKIVPNQSKKPIGYFKNVVNNVFNKDSNNFSWNDSSIGKKVHENESVRTESHSSTKIILDSGSEINLGENSMILLRKEDSNFNVEILDGKAFLNALNSKIKVKTNGQEIIVDAKTQVEFKDNQINVITGSANVDGNSVQSGQSLNLETKEVKDLTFKNISPANNTVFNYIGKAQPINFVWTSKEKQVKVMLKHSNEEMFTVTGKSSSLKEGDYVWKLVTESGEESPENSFSLKNVIPIAQSPIGHKYNEDETKVDFYIAKDDDLIQIKQIYAAEDISFTNMIKVDSNYTFKKGEYYWKFLYEFKGKEYSSETYQFSVLGKPEVIKMVSFQPEKEDVYYTENPKIDIKWDSEKNESIIKWKVEVVQNNSLIKDIYIQYRELSVTLKETQQATVTIKGINKDGFEVLNYSKNLKIIKVPNLDKVNLNKRYESDDSGLFVFDLEGKKKVKKCSVIVSKKDYNAEKDCLAYVEFQNLNPGSYDITLKLTDLYDREYEVSKKSVLNVPFKTNISYPKIKRVKIGDANE